MGGVGLALAVRVLDTVGDRHFWSASFTGQGFSVTAAVQCGLWSQLVESAPRQESQDLGRVLLSPGGGAVPVGGGPALHVW